MTPAQIIGALALAAVCAWLGYVVGRVRGYSDGMDTCQRWLIDAKKEPPK